MQTEEAMLQEPNGTVETSFVLRLRKRNQFLPDNTEIETSTSSSNRASTSNTSLYSSKATKILSETVSSSSSSSDSDSDCLRKQSSLKNPKRKRKYSASKRVDSKKRVIRLSDDELTENKRKMIENETLDKAIAIRTKFSHRIPFLYKTSCNCKNHYFCYIYFAIRHVEKYHKDTMGNNYNGIISLIDDFNVIGRYPLKCEHCPFRSNLQEYLNNHIEHCHFQINE